MVSAAATVWQLVIQPKYHAHYLWSAKSIYTNPRQTYRSSFINDFRDIAHNG